MDNLLNSGCSDIATSLYVHVSLVNLIENVQNQPGEIRNLSGSRG